MPKVNVDFTGDSTKRQPVNRPTIINDWEDDDDDDYDYDDEIIEEPVPTKRQPVNRSTIINDWEDDDDDDDYDDDEVIEEPVPAKRQPVNPHYFDNWDDDDDDDDGDDDDEVVEESFPAKLEKLPTTKKLGVSAVNRRKTELVEESSETEATDDDDDVEESDENYFDKKEGKWVIVDDRPLPLAKTYLQARCQHEGHRTLHYCEKEYYRWGCGDDVIDDADPEKMIKDHFGYQSETQEELFGKVQAFFTYHCLEYNDRDKKYNELVPFSAYNQIVNQTVTAIKHVARLPRGKQMNSWIGNETAPVPMTDLLFCPTKIYNWRTKEFIKPSPNWFVTRTLGVDIDPDAPEPMLWLKLVDDIYRNKKGFVDQEAIQFLYQFYAMLLTDSNRWEKGLLLKGVTRSGKSTLVRVIRKIPL